MATGVAPRLQSERGARERPGWVRFPHVPAIRAACAAFLLLGAVAGGAAAQEGEEPERQGQEQGPEAEGGERQDSEADRDPQTPDALERPPAQARDTLPPVSPVGALMRSLVVPGWGQASVGRPVRGGIYFAAEGLSLLMVFKTQAKLRAARQAEPPDEGLVESRTGQRENWIVLAGFVAFLSGLDAWVSTHFWDFEPEVRPPADGSAGAELRWSVPVSVP